MSDLTQKRCVPCEGGTPPLTDERVKQLLPQIPGWELEEGKLVSRFKFQNFAAL